ncbi:suppressor of presenilin protein 4-like isoform X2 [Odontomachus brunneus]|uniref:suppressor of presenilin protein 4-like isoform X2 n=1 Tax=Odontomachus brunneus TaxID=486640 RepID=UPI0013F1BAE1|nr:suppressor of presenilin protein 4-like isoform X2 [Odontomachus brunneus]
MLPAAGKAERRSLRGSARLSSKMSGRQPRLRMLRPRPQQQQQQQQQQQGKSNSADASVTVEATSRRAEGNLKETEKLADARKRDARPADAKAEYTKASAMANEVDDGGGGGDDDDDDDDSYDGELMIVEDEPALDVDLKKDEEVIDLEPNANSYECKNCKPPKTLPSIKAYLEHLRRDHKHKWNLDRHTRNHGCAGAFQCRACNFTADIRQSLTVHEANHHDPPVGQVSRKSNNSFERKPRNSPKRYNQVGASDFQEGMRGLMASSIPDTSDSSVILVEDKKSALAGAECIALKCEEKGCQFITAWDSEMQRHLAECHKPVVSPKSKKPLPMLIPLGSPNSKPSNAVNSGPPTTLLKVPRVRVRPELAQIARDTELAKMYGNKEATNSKKDLNTAAGIFERKNASFFDKLKEKLTTATNNGIREIAVSNVNDLKCWCTFKASSMEELALHKQTHHTALSVSVGTTRCPKCRRRCKSSTDLQVHMQSCHTTTDSSLEKIMSRSDVRMTPYRGEYAFPSQLDWDASLRGLNSSGSSFKGGSTLTSGRRVFKCPHCPFWASTASRFHVHIVGHLNRKPFECSMCAYRSNWRWDITKHIKLKAAKDAVHITAKVLMTDETGRRNYSKYKKYLAQIENLIWDEDRLEQRSVEETSSNEPPTKLLIINNKEHISTDQTSSSPITILSSTDSSRNDHHVNLSLRPPPPLRSATRSRGQSLLKNNPITMNMQSVGGTCGGAVTISSTTATDESKRTQWKCKRCNYRDSNKDNVLLHVRSHYESNDQEPTDPERNPFGCGDCPFSAPDAATLSLHRMHHRPNLDAIFKCYRCPYYVSTKAELLEHARLHGEELATVHQQSMDHQQLPDSKKYKKQHSLISDSGALQSKSEMPMEQMAQITARNKATSVLKSPKITGGPPPLLLDTRILSESPLVWVTRPDGTLNKMFKCRHCPYISLRRVEVQDHEVMHTPTEESVISCTDCTFTCSRKDIINAHTEMHNGCLGTVHCLVDETRPDNQQVNDLVNLLALKHPPAMGPEPDLRDSRLVHCCNKCPARFLCEKELRIHLRYHTTDLAYSCQWCSYAARQPSHLLAHQKAHSTEYQERTKYLLTMYNHSQRFPPPSTACVETETNQEDNNCGFNVAWIVVQLNENSSSSTSIGQRSGNQVFTCAKCPARYFKLDALEYHMTLHGSNNRFKCNDCDYSSKTAQNLVKHQVVHRRHNETNESASSPTSMPTSPVSISPLNMELPEPQYSLYARGNPNFVYPSYLRNGRIKEKRYKCHKCPSAFDKREQYRVHLTLHGSKQRYRCQTCDYSVQYYANYAQHRRKHLANAEAQASRRQFEDDRFSLDSDTDVERPPLRSSKSLRSSVSVYPIMTAVANDATNAATNAASNAASNAETSATTNVATNAATNNVALQPSNQDKQTLLLMQRKGIVQGADAVEIRCQYCPFCTLSTDKETMDAHKRRHGIERMTPPCPHCDYVPRKDENVGEHIRLHFNRLYKPESYVIVELLTLTMEKMPTNSRDEKQLRPKELLFKECADGKFLPLAESLHSNSLKSSPSSMKALKEKVMVDLNTGETKHLAA